MMPPTILTMLNGIPKTLRITVPNTRKKNISNKA